MSNQTSKKPYVLERVEESINALSTLDLRVREIAAELADGSQTHWEAADRVLERIAELHLAGIISTIEPSSSDRASDPQVA